MTWRAHVLTLFPEMFPATLGFSLLEDARQRGVWDLSVTSMRDAATDKHRTVDDVPYGGGAGMVMKPDVVARAIEALPTDVPLYYLSPRGVRFDQALAQTLAAGKGVALLCGRYEGVDQRVLDHYNIPELSLGDYILMGGEAAACVVIESCVRLLAGVTGNRETHDEESFTAGLEGLLEYPHYTRPPEWQGRMVPEVLLSGHHGKIAAWRRQQAEILTQERRPDLWQVYEKQHKGEKNQSPSRRTKK